MSQKFIDEHISRSGTQLTVINVVKHLHRIIPKMSTFRSIKVTADHTSEVSEEC